LIGIGALGLFGYFLIAVVGFSYLVGFGPEEYDAAESHDIGISILGVCTPMICIPSILFFYFGWRGYNRDKYLQKIAGFLLAYRDININDLALKLNKPAAEVELDILKCLNEGLINGYIDPISKKFVVTHYPTALHGTPNVSVSSTPLYPGTRTPFTPLSTISPLPPSPSQQYPSQQQYPPHYRYPRQYQQQYQQPFKPPPQESLEPPPMKLKPLRE